MPSLLPHVLKELVGQLQGVNRIAVLDLSLIDLDNLLFNFPNQRLTALVDPVVVYDFLHCYSLSRTFGEHASEQLFEPSLVLLLLLTLRKPQRHVYNVIIHRLGVIALIEKGMDQVGEGVEGDSECPDVDWPASDAEGLVVSHGVDVLGRIEGLSAFDVSQELVLFGLRVSEKRNPEISEFSHSLLAEQDVLWLYVSMEDAVDEQIVQAFDSIAYEPPAIQLNVKQFDKASSAAIPLDKLSVLAELQDQIEVLIVRVEDDFVKPYEVIVIELFHDCDFLHCQLSPHLFLVLSSEPLEIVCSLLPYFLYCEFLLLPENTFCGPEDLCEAASSNTLRNVVFVQGPAVLALLFDGLDHSPHLVILSSELDILQLIHNNHWIASTAFSFKYRSML